MKKATLIAVVAGLATVAAWSIPASAEPVFEAHDKEPGRYHDKLVADAPEPGSLALLALGLSGLGVTSLRRRRKK